LEVDTEEVGDLRLRFQAVPHGKRVTGKEHIPAITDARRLHGNNTGQHRNTMRPKPGNEIEAAGKCGTAGGQCRLTSHYEFYTFTIIDEIGL
jgi:hypothetical protein